MALLHAEQRHRALRINQGAREYVLWAQEPCCLCGGILAKDPRKSCSSWYISPPLSVTGLRQKGNNKAERALSRVSFINIVA